MTDQQPQQPQPPQAQPQQAQAQAPRTTKLFIGNLSPNIRESEVQQELEAATNTKVVSAVIIRGRAPNFGFFEVESEQAANTAIQVLHKKMIDGQPISVEISRSGGPTSRRRARFGGAYGGGGFPAAGGYMYRGPAPQQALPTLTSAMGALSVGQPQPMQAPPRRFNNRAPPPQQQQPMMMMPPPQQQYRGGAGGRYPSGPMRRPPPQGDRTPSKTTLYVGNLPYVVTDENLYEIFTDMNIKEAHVVKHPNGMSRGFGFVEFNTEEDMRLALQSVERVEVEGQVIVITPAVSKPMERRNAYGAAQPQGYGAPQPQGYGAPQPQGYGAPQPAAQPPAPQATPQAQQPASTTQGAAVAPSK